MKRTLMAAAASLLLATTACSQHAARTDANESDGIAVAYFSATGTTERVAKEIASVTGGRLIAIKPAQPYTAADLDWHDSTSRSSVEMNDPKARPAIATDSAGLDGCDTLLLGYPIWWNQAPRVVNTFIESADLTGVVVIPFATSGGSGITNSVDGLRTAYPGIDIRDGHLLNGRITRETITNLLKD